MLQKGIRPPAKINAPSRPGEFHPQALTDPDVTVSRHPARIIPPLSFPSGLTLSPGSSHLWLTKQCDQMTQPLRSIPITGTSTLLRVGPPLCPASVLSPLWGLHLGFSLNIRATGSHVPHRSQDQVPATSMSDATQAVNRFPLDLSWDIEGTPSFDVV